MKRRRRQKTREISRNCGIHRIVDGGPDTQEPQLSRRGSSPSGISAQTLTRKPRGQAVDADPEQATSPVPMSPAGNFVEPVNERLDISPSLSRILRIQRVATRAIFRTRRVARRPAHGSLDYIMVGAGAARSCILLFLARGGSREFGGSGEDDTDVIPRAALSLPHGFLESRGAVCCSDLDAPAATGPVGGLLNFILQYVFGS